MTLRARQLHLAVAIHEGHLVHVDVGSLAFGDRRPDRLAQMRLRLEQVDLTIGPTRSAASRPIDA